jgi:hypothetical protein
MDGFHGGAVPDGEMRARDSIKKEKRSDLRLIVFL